MKLSFKNRFYFRLNAMIDEDNNKVRYAFCQEIANMFVDDYRFRSLFTGYSDQENMDLYNVLKDLTPFQRGHAVFAKLVGQEYKEFIF
jgi:hypothetical protein